MTGRIQIAALLLATFAMAGLTGCAHRHHYHDHHPPPPPMHDDHNPPPPPPHDGYDH
ncbi:MAG: hypothetical protein WA700_12260 [Acidobacteriaceae bacterium]